MDNQDDQLLIKKAKTSPEAFELLYKKYAGNIYNYFWYRVGHQSEVAEDLMQETFLRAFAHLPKFKKRGYSYLTFLYRIAHNLLVNYYRTPRAISLESVGPVPVEITQQIEKKLEAENLWRAVQQLSPNEKSAILLRYKEGWSIRKIARSMGKTENAVKLLLSRSRKKLALHPCLKDMRHFTNQPHVLKPARFLENIK